MAAVGVEKGVIGEFAEVEEFDPVLERCVGLLMSSGGDAISSGFSCTQ